MLEHVDSSVEAFLRATAPLDASDIDVSFDAPDREWSAKLARPTVNVFLWDIRRSAERSQSGLNTVERNGVRRHEAPMPVIELRYVITAWGNVRDERPLLSGLTRALLAWSMIPREFLDDAIAHLEEPTLVLARSGEDHMDVFKALEGQVKPGLNVVLTTQFDTGVELPISTPVESVGLTLHQRHRRVAGEVVNAEQRGAIGALVSNGDETTRVNAAGQFLIIGSSGDEVVVNTDPPLVGVVPDEGGIRIE